MPQQNAQHQQGFDFEKEAKAAETTGELTLLSVGATGNRRLSTKRIAEITGKEHYNVLRDVREMCAGLGITPVVATTQNRGIDSEGVIFEHYANGDVLQYYLNEHYCLTLATGYNVKLRDLIIGEWEQLKKKLSTPALPDFTNPAVAARAFADEYERRQKAEAEKRVVEAENRKLEGEKAVLLPKAEVADMIANSEKYYPVGQVANLLHVPHEGQNLLFVILLRQKAIFRRDGAYRPYQEYVDAGYLVVVMTQIYKDGRPKPYAQVMVTGKGLSWVARLVEKDRQERLRDFIPPVRGGEK